MKFRIPKFQRGQNSNLIGSLALIAITGLGVLWAVHHARAEAPASADLSVIAPTAGVAKVTREDLYKQVTIAAEFRPYAEVALHAKVSGYVKKMNVDFGDQVEGRTIVGHARSSRIAG